MLWLEVQAFLLTLENLQINLVALSYLLGRFLASGPQHIVHELHLVGVAHAGLIHRRLLRCWSP